MDTKPTKPLESEIPWLHPDHLMDFLDELREAGFAVGVSDYVKVHQLVIRLLANGVELQQPEQFGRYLGPLLCSSEIEQIEFQQRFANWIARLKAAANARTQNEAQKALQEERERTSQRRRIVGTRVILAILGIIFAALVLFIPENVTENFEFIQAPLEAESPDNPLQPTLTKSPDNPLQPTETPFPESPENDLAQGQIINVLVVLVLVSLGVFWVIFVRWRARHYLERRSTKDKPQLDTISIAHDTEVLFPPIAFFRLAERMRRRVRVASREIDIHATLQHALSQGGWLMPVPGTRLQVPEYLVLIDRTTFRDHQTRLIEKMVAQLTEHEVFASIFFFDRDPRVCYPADGKRRGVTLQALSKSHPDHRLLLFADAEHLFHPLRNELAVWTDFFFAWSERVLLTTKSREHWGYYETELQSVITVLPARADSLMNFVMGNLLEPQQKTEQTRPPLPRLLTERPYRWLSRDQPDEALIERVLLGLRAYLDRAGFFWLCACAIFPKLEWDITLYLGQHLKTDEGSTLLSYERLVDLARLPWFRHGYMPDWFRLYLISTLTPAQEGDVRQTLQALLLNTVSGSVRPHPLQIARPLDFWSRSILRVLARNASENSPFQDYIFRTYVAHNKRLSVRMPIQLRDRLLSGDRRSLDWAIWRQWTISHAIGGTLIWLIAFCLLEQESFFIDEHEPSPLWLLVIALVVFSFASLQVWAGRRRIEPDWSAFRSSLGGMAFTHVSIVILFVIIIINRVQSVLLDQWIIVIDWPLWLWALIGGVIGLSDSLGRYLFSKRGTVNRVASIKPYGSVLGFTIGFILLNLWVKIDMLPDVFRLGIPFLIWACYGMGTGVALVWENPKAISIANIWLQTKFSDVGKSSYFLNYKSKFFYKEFFIKY